MLGWKGHTGSLIQAHSSQNPTLNPWQCCLNPPGALGTVPIPRGAPSEGEKTFPKSNLNPPGGSSHSLGAVPASGREFWRVVAPCTCLCFPWAQGDRSIPSPTGGSAGQEGWRHLRVFPKCSPFLGELLSPLSPWKIKTEG